MIYIYLCLLFYFSTDYFNNIVVLCNYSSSIFTGVISTGGSGAAISTGGSGAAISTGGSGAGNSGAITGNSGAITGNSGAAISTGGSGAGGPDIAPSFGTSQYSFGTSQYSFGSLGVCHNPESVGSNTPQSQCSRTNPRTVPDTPDMFFSSSGLSPAVYRAGMILILLLCNFII